MKMEYEEPRVIEINDRVYGDNCHNGTGDNCDIGCTNGDTPMVYYPGHGYIHLGCGTGNGV